LRPHSPLAAEGVFGTGCTVMCFDSGNAPLTDFAASRRLADNTINPKTNMSKKSPECYTTDPNAECLRVEISPGHSLLLPHDEFAFAELKNEEKEQNLRLVFAEHEVLIRGYCLRRIETALQQMELAFIAKLPDNQRRLIAEGQPVILDIIVTEVAPE
jgi:hypothetical protein